ncbi:MAG: hypothetical protein UT94_C0029G0001 [Candidatus Uhrbacteria bacterium GW2011_GWF2_40_263]|nr:MAG: hypothetical protein UT94_C0029G0001 [Candidatus Uhrbacteria bacterium GW2011_GWF2_40_263]
MIEEGWEDVEQEQQEKRQQELDAEKAYQKFEEALEEIPPTDRGRSWASIYVPIVNRIDRNDLCNILFWQKVFSRNRFDISSEGIFSALPPEVQEDLEVQKFFFNQPNFCLHYLSKTIMERVQPEFVVKKWLSSGPREETFGQTPWKHLDRIQKRRYVQDALASIMHFRAIDNERRGFIDAFKQGEWDVIAREGYQKDGLSIVEAIRDDDLTRVLEVLSQSEIRKILIETHNTYDQRSLYLSLSLPILRELEFEDEQIEQWKIRQEGSQNDFSRGFEDCEKMTPDDRAWTIALIPKRAEVYLEKYQEFIRKKLFRLIEQLPPAAVEKNLVSLDRLFCQSWELEAKELTEGIIRPLLENQGAAAFRTFDILTEVVSCEYGNFYFLDLVCPDRESAKVFRQLMNKTGARFQDFLQFYIDSSFGKDNLGVLQGTTIPLREEVHLVPYLDAKLPWTPRLFHEFKTRIASGQSVQDVAREMTKEVQHQIKEIHDGDYPEEGLDSYQLGIVSHIFPPALGVSRQEYDWLIQRRKDRQDDVPVEWNVHQGKEVTFPLGKWELTSGKEFDTTPWNRLSEVVGLVNGKKIITREKEKAESDELLMGPSVVVEVGRKMVDLLAESGPAQTKEALRNGYAFYLARGGAKLPDFISGREEAVRFFEWLKDSLRDVVSVALQAYEAADPKGYQEKIAQAIRRDISPRTKKMIARSIAGILRNDRMDERQKSERINAIARDLGVKFEGDIYDHVLQTIKEEGTEITEKMIEDSLDVIFVGAKGTTSETGKISSIIVTKILGADASAMEKEMSKWSFVEGAEGGEVRTLRFQITKRKMHAVAGLNMGVCVAVDDQLWNKQEFSNVVMFGDDGVARGGMHFEIIHEDGEVYLSLPGINPSLSVLREVNGEKLVQAMLDYAKQCAKAIGAKSVLIPSNPTIFSNREELHAIIKRLQLPMRSLSHVHQFSYSPFAYSWQDAYEITII